MANNKTERKNTVCKIVYFDVDSVTDYVQIVAGGELEKTTELLKSNEKKQNKKLRSKEKVELVGYSRLCLDGRLRQKEILMLEYHLIVIK